MTLTINYTDLTQNTSKTLIFKASNKYIMSEKVQFLFSNSHIESWMAETKEWNAGNKGNNAEYYLHQFLSN